MHTLPSALRHQPQALPAPLTRVRRRRCWTTSSLRRAHSSPPPPRCPPTRRRAQTREAHMHAA
eukprot:1953205-Pleurochrysis_carterae.AAC.1